MPPKLFLIACQRVNFVWIPNKFLLCLISCSLSLEAVVAEGWKEVDLRLEPSRILPLTPSYSEPAIVLLVDIMEMTE